MVFHNLIESLLLLSLTALLRAVSEEKCGGFVLYDGHKRRIFCLACDMDFSDGAGFLRRTLPSGLRALRQLPTRPAHSGGVLGGFAGRQILQHKRTKSGIQVAIAGKQFFQVFAIEGQ